MKLASLRNGTRDGQLVVVSSDLQRAIAVPEIAPTLLDAIERWSVVEAPLRAKAAELAASAPVGTAAPSAARTAAGTAAASAATRGGVLAFDATTAMAPLPRCYQWLDGSTFANHGALMESAFDMGIKNEYEKFPLVYQGASDDFLGPCDDVRLPSEADNMDFEGEVAVVVDEVPMGTSRDAAGAHIKLLMLVNDVSLRGFAVREMKTGFGWVQAKPSTAFSPVAVTPDELGDAWHDGRVHLSLDVERSGAWFGHPHGSEMTFNFFRLIEHAAYSRTLRAGTILGSGTMSNASRSAGSACIAERRAIEMLDQGAVRTPFMRFGERVRLQMRDAAGRSIFGAIDQTYVKA